MPVKGCFCSSIFAGDRQTYVSLPWEFSTRFCTNEVVCDVKSSISFIIYKGRSDEDVFCVGSFLTFRSSAYSLPCTLVFY